MARFNQNDAGGFNTASTSESGRVHDARGRFTSKNTTDYGVVFGRDGQYRDSDGNALTAEQALARATAHGYRVPALGDPLWKDGRRGPQPITRNVDGRKVPMPELGHRESCGCPTCWIDAYGTPDSVRASDECEGMQVFTCNGCAKVRPWALETADGAMQIVAERTHAVAQSLLADNGYGRALFHPDVLLGWRCAACHGQHADAAIVLTRASA